MCASIDRECERKSSFACIYVCRELRHMNAMCFLWTQLLLIAIAFTAVLRLNNPAVGNCCQSQHLYQPVESMSKSSADNGIVQRSEKPFQLKFQVESFVLSKGKVSLTATCPK